MSRDRYYQHLLNSKEWKELRARQLREHPLCQMCEREGKVTAAIDVHHVEPIEASMSHAKMRELCFNPANLMSLCIPCHIQVHKELRSHSKDVRAERTNQRLSRWIERHEGRVGQPGASFRSPPPSESEIHLPLQGEREMKIGFSFSQNRGEIGKGGEGDEGGKMGTEGGNGNGWGK